MKEVTIEERILQEIEEVESQVRQEITKENLAKGGIKIDDSEE